MTRPSWDQYFITMAQHVAMRGTCDRKRVGCVLTIGRRVVATGYNGSLPGTPHCDDVGHQMEDGHCIRTVHAEQNAVCQSARHGVALEGATAYVTCAPCPTCFKTLVAAGIKRIVYGEPYRNDRLLEEAKATGVVVEEAPCS